MTVFSGCTRQKNRHIQAFSIVFPVPSISDTTAKVFPDRSPKKLERRVRQNGHLGANVSRRETFALTLS